MSQMGHQCRFDVGGMFAIALIATKMLRRDERRKGSEALTTTATAPARAEPCPEISSTATSGPAARARLQKIASVVSRRRMLRSTISSPPYTPEKNAAPKQWFEY